MGSTLEDCRKSRIIINRAVTDAYNYARRRGDRLSKCSWRDGDDIAQSYIVRVLERGFQDMGVKFLMNDARFQSSAMSRLKGFDGRGEIVQDDMPSDFSIPDFMMIESARRIASGLSHKYETLFDCIYMNDMTLDETASYMGMSKSWVDKASTKLKMMMIEAMK